jgi:hypothetical protein
MTTLRQKYLEAHKDKLQDHYQENSWGGIVLGMLPEWKEGNMPGDMSASKHSKDFECWLLDQHTSLVHKTLMVVAYEHAFPFLYFMDDDWNQLHLPTVQGYFYGSHHCPCHRKNDAIHQVGIDTDEECEGDRFLIDRLVVVDTDLILLSETRTVEQLEETLLK